MADATIKTTVRRQTKGPWRVIIDDTGGPFSGWPSIEAPEDVDASVIHRAGFKQEYWGDWSQREAVANAHLIAAAPELLVALEAMVVHYTAMINSGDAGNWNPETDDEVIAARAAIRKATQTVE